MSQDTTFTEFKRKGNPMKAIGVWIGLVVGVVGLASGFSKLYFETPLVLKEHDKKIEKLEAIDAATSTELRSQRDLLLEIRGDIKVLNRQGVVRNTP